MKPIDVFVRVERVQNFFRIDMLRQRQLHEDAVARRVVVQFVDESQKIGLARFGGKPVLPGIHADFDGLLGLVRHIDLARRIFTDEHDGKARLYAMLLHQPRDFRCHFGANVGRDLFSIDDLRSGHSPSFLFAFCLYWKIRLHRSCNILSSAIRVAVNPQGLEPRLPAGRQRNRTFRHAEPSGDELFKCLVSRSILRKCAHTRLKGRAVGGVDEPVDGIFGGFRCEAKVRDDACGAVPPSFGAVATPAWLRLKSPAFAMFGRTTLCTK